MANYYTRAVLENTRIALTQEHKQLLQMTGADLEERENPNGVLDQVANCDQAVDVVGHYYIFWTEHIEFCLEEAIHCNAEWIIRDDDGAQVHNDTIEKFERRWADCELADLLRDILDYNPQEAFLQVNYSHSCSKMRPDGFGGGLLVVTRTQSFDLNTYSLVRGADKDGNILLNLPSVINFDDSVKC